MLLRLPSTVPCNGIFLGRGCETQLHGTVELEILGEGGYETQLHGTVKMENLRRGGV